VYLVFHPDAEAIKVEATNPDQAVLVPDERFKKQFIDYLREVKVLSQRDLDTTSVEYLFEKNYYAPKKITLENLLGVQYYNLGMLYLNEEKYLEAFYQYEKALVFFNDPLIQFMVKNTLQMYLSATGFKRNDVVDLFVQHTRYSISQKDRDFSKYLFTEYLNEMLVENGYPDTLKAGYARMVPGLADSVLARDLDFAYQYEMGRYYYRTGSSGEALGFMDKALRLKPENIDAQSAIVYLLSLQKEQGAQARETLPVSEKYYNNLPELKRNKNYTILHAKLLLSAARESFRMEAPAEGDAYLCRFEEVFASVDHLEVNADFICDAYTEAAVYCFARNNARKAKSYIERGLQIAPRNYRLQQLERNL